MASGADGDETKDLLDYQKHYSSVLCELWDGYTKFLHVGMAAAGFTIVAVGQYLKDASELAADVSFYVKATIVLAGISGVSFALCRWLSQVLMERQVYGPVAPVKAYFEECETRLPNALRYSGSTLRWFYKLNDFCKFVGAITLLLSWISVLVVLFGQVDASAFSNP